MQGNQTGAIPRQTTSIEWLSDAPDFPQAELTV
jgi:hypothetical protein